MIDMQGYYVIPNQEVSGNPPYPSTIKYANNEAPSPDYWGCYTRNMLDKEFQNGGWPLEGKATDNYVLNGLIYRMLPDFLSHVSTSAPFTIAVWNIELWKIFMGAEVEGEGEVILDIVDLLGASYGLLVGEEVGPGVVIVVDHG